MKIIVKGLILLCTVFFVTNVFGEDAKQKPQLIFPNYKAVGALSKKEKDKYLKKIGELPAKEKEGELVGSVQLFSFWDVEPKPYEHTECQIGYLSFVTTSGNNLRDVQSAQSVQADSTLTRIDVRLDRLRVYDYPGSGNHQVMFTFQADNSMTQEAQKENISFSQVYEAQEGEGAGVAGYPIFIGLNVGKQGAALKGATINVKNGGDEKALRVLKSKEFQGGLTLLTTAQPALSPFSALGTGIAEMVLSRNENKKVHECYLGLDFDSGASYGARLASGNYIIVQAPDNKFRWNDWAYDPANARIVKKSNPNDIVPYNYVIFRVVRHTD